MNSEWLFEYPPNPYPPPMSSVVGCVCIYMVSIYDYVSNVNFSVGGPKEKGAGAARGGASPGLQ